MCSAVDGSMFEEAHSASEAVAAGGQHDGEVHAESVAPKTRKHACGQ